MEMNGTDVIFFGGQSNMQGQSEALSSTEPVENAMEYRWLSDTVIPLRNPVGEDIGYDHTAGYPAVEGGDPYAWYNRHVTGSACYGHTNLVPSFCKTYVERTGRRVLAAHIAKGSTTVSDWLKGSAGYDILLKKGGGALRAAGTPQRIFFVWLQGESDAVAGNSKELYKEQITRLKNDLMADLGVEKFGIIRVGRFAGEEPDGKILAAQDEVCREDPDFLMLTDIATTLNGMPEYMHPRLAGHFSARGLEKLGYEAGKTLGDFVAGQKG